MIHITLAVASHPEQEPHVRHVHTSAHTRTLGPYRPRGHVLQPRHAPAEHDDGAVHPVLARVHHRAHVRGGSPVPAAHSGRAGRRRRGLG
ncbi:hypothetical protein MICRO11B_20075 [Micrococcus luteus]|nr:hypothetical protein MICRO116_900018 [Micrococcus sp. 116]VXB18157.1 hypothetical protein MICRO11B_20075 [Micrococcus luteus]